MRTYLEVPYSEKEQAKRAGAKWDGSQWYVDNPENMAAFLRWLPYEAFEPRRRTKYEIEFLARKREEKLAGKRKKK